MRLVGRRLGTVGREAAQFGRKFVTVMAAAGVAVGALILRFGAAGDSIAKTADKLGVGVVELQRLQYAAKLAGIPIRTFDMAFQRFTRRTAEAAAGTGEARGALEFLGIALRNTEGRLRPAGILLEEVAEAMAKIEDPALRVRIAFKLFDSEGVSMVNMLLDGSKAIRDAGDEAERLGIITEADARASEKFTDALARVQQAAMGLRNEIGGELIPRITEMIGKFTEWLVGNRAEIVMQLTGAFRDLGEVIRFVVGMVRSVVDGGRELLAWIRWAVPWLGKIIDKFTGWAARDQSVEARRHRAGGSARQGR